MLAHPAGKGRAWEDVKAERAARDDQPGIIEQLLSLDVPQLPAFDEEVYEVMAGLAGLMISKQADYGPRAINDSPGGALNGINVRMHDKLSRVIHLLGSPRTYNHESVRDTYRDLANYAVIAVMVLDETWPQ